MTDKELIDKLKTVRLSGGRIRTVDGLNELQEQLDRTAHECDSSMHEVAAVAIRWAVSEICRLNGIVGRVKDAVGIQE